MFRIVVGLVIGLLLAASGAAAYDPAPREPLEMRSISLGCVHQNGRLSCGATNWPKGSVVVMIGRRLVRVGTVEYRHGQPFYGGELFRVRR